MIEVQNLTKQYRELVAVDNVSFEVNKGDILGFLGPNGAGKTTTMRMITGFLSPTRGSTLVNGRSVFDDPMRVKRQIGYLPEAPPLYLDMKVEIYLDHVAHLKGLPHRDVRKEVSRVQSLCGIQHVSHRLIRNLSKGYRQRVGLAQALLGSPDVLILDEPTVGLDPAQIREVRYLIRDLAQEHTVILSTHILPEVQMICNRAIIIHGGRVVASDTIENLNRSAGVNRQRIVLESPSAKAKELLRKTKTVTRIEELGTDLSFDVQLIDDKPSTRTSLLQELSAAGLPVAEYANITATLEDVFLQIVSGDGLGQDNANDAIAPPATETKAESVPAKEATNTAKPASAKAETKKEDNHEEKAQQQASSSESSAKKEEKAKQSSSDSSKTKTKKSAKRRRKKK